MKTKKRTKKIEHQNMSAAEYLRLPYSRMVMPESDGSYRAEIIEFPGCLAIGETDVEALQALTDAAESWIEAALEMGQAIPMPLESNEGFSGKLVLRMPRSLHRKAAHLADLEGVSLNQLIVTSLAEQLGTEAAKKSWSNPSIVVLSTSALGGIKFEKNVDHTPVDLGRFTQWQPVLEHKQYAGS